MIPVSIFFVEKNWCYLFKDYALCEDNLNFKFAVHEYCFVFGSFVLLAEYARYYKHREFIVKLGDESDDVFETNDDKATRNALL